LGLPSARPINFCSFGHGATERLEPAVQPAPSALRLPPQDRHISVNSTQRWAKCLPGRLPGPGLVGFWRYARSSTCITRPLSTQSWTDHALVGQGLESAAMSLATDSSFTSSSTRPEVHHEFRNVRPAGTHNSRTRTPRSAALRLGSRPSTVRTHILRLLDGLSHYYATQLFTKEFVSSGYVFC
jgi:hypothetical protein